MAYYEYLREIAQYLEIQAQITLKDLLSLPGVLELEEETADWEGAWPAVALALESALQEVQTTRLQEGERLAGDLRHRVRRLLAYAEQIDVLREDLLSRYRQRLALRLEELLGPVAVDNRRVEEEVVIFAERSDVTEELVRLRSHLAAILTCLDDEGPLGRKLEFLAQEVHRELTTLGTKAAGTVVTPLVISCKEELEKIREQAQNFE